MKSRYRIKIAHKLMMGFGIVLIISFLSNRWINNMLKENKLETKKISEIYSPVSDNLDGLKSLIYKSLLLTTKIEPNSGESFEYKELKYSSGVKYPELKDFLKSKSAELQPENKIKLNELLISTDLFFINQDELLNIISDTLSIVVKSKEQITEHLKIKEHIVDSISAICIVRMDTIQNRFKLITQETSKAMSKSFVNFSDRILYQAIVLFIMIILIASLTGASLIMPLNKIKDVIISIGNGVLPTSRFATGKDEIGKMGEAINILVDGLNEKADFAQDIGNENYDSKFIPLDDDDVLGNSLLTMRDNLAKASEEAELRRIENKQRGWSSQGLAKFSEILRKHSDNLESFSSITISELTNYLGAKVGGLYMLVEAADDEEAYLELVAFYAYDRQKFVEKKIGIGENLVGQCVLESETIYMTDIPDGYVHISSGLGKDSPKSLLIVPLKLNEEIYGVVELASFEDFQDYQIQFVEKIGESIASTIANIKINIQTSKLLEGSNEKSERLAKQEEESKKNIEQLKLAKEEILEREKENIAKHEKAIDEYLNRIKELENKVSEKEDIVARQKTEQRNEISAINNSAGTLAVDFDGRVMTVNSRYLKMAETGFSDIKGRYLHEFVEVSVASSDAYKKIWTELKFGKVYSGVFKYNFSGNEKWFYETYTPVKDVNGRFQKVMVIANDITSLEEAKRKVELNIDGIVK